MRWRGICWRRRRWSGGRRRERGGRGSGRRFRFWDSSTVRCMWVTARVRLTETRAKAPELSNVLRKRKPWAEIKESLSADKFGGIYRDWVNEAVERVKKKWHGYKIVSLFKVRGRVVANDCATRVMSQSWDAELEKSGWLSVKWEIRGDHAQAWLVNEPRGSCGVWIPFEKKEVSFLHSQFFVCNFWS